MALTNSTTPARWRRLMPVAFILTAGALGGSALAETAHACAAPSEWDIGAFDQCLKSGLGQGFSDEEYQQHYKYCCLQSGGRCESTPYGCKCVAPPANPAQGPMAPPSGGVATQTLAPAPPPPIRNPGVVTTFVPAPIGPVG
jgi:hypothetical protein